MRKLTVFYMLLIVQLSLFCQSTNLAPHLIGNSYCFDTVQVRQIAKLVLMNGYKDTLITALDSKICDLESREVINDSIIKGNNVVFDNLKEIINNKDAVITKEKEVNVIDRKKWRKQKKTLITVIVIESLFLLVIMVLK